MDIDSEVAGLLQQYQNLPDSCRQEILGLEDPLWPDAMQKHIGSIALPAALQSHNDRPQRSPTRLMGSPYPFRLVTILKGSVSSLSTAIITVLPNEK
ncbi:hypothetical protein PENSUB_8507 [Penicillium subrubescens]|uniref:Uncharacterized protein n=1 Tax=Penicillium subrubescens TaxID=1316194 RepID=A0A1Q5TFZ0_9EURO|nr:hypothetical protein PENSUB_8507 [Penicillium subrubescens]